MVLNESEVMEAQAAQSALEAKRESRRILERSSPKQERSPSVEHISLIASQFVNKLTIMADTHAAALLEIDDKAQTIPAQYPGANFDPKSSSKNHAALIALSPRRKKDHHARIHSDLMATPQFNSLNGIEHRTLTSMLLYTNRNRIARPGYTHLLKGLGIPNTSNNRAQIKRGISGLKSHGIIWTISPGYPGHTAEYFVAQNQQHIDFILSLNGVHRLSPKMEDNTCPPLGEMQ